MKKNLLKLAVILLCIVTLVTPIVKNRNLTYSTLQVENSVKCVEMMSLSTLFYTYFLEKPKKSSSNNYVYNQPMFSTIDVKSVIKNIYGDITNNINSGINYIKNVHI